MSLSTLEDTTARGLDACINQCGRLLSVRWWSLIGGGYPEVQALRRVFKVSLSDLARANGCHLPANNDRLAKAMLGHVCFDAAMQAAASELKGAWSICGGYALSCLTRSTEPHARYKYVEHIFSPASGKVTEDLWLAPHVRGGGSRMDKTFYFGDVDFFLTNASLNEHLAAGGTGTPAPHFVTPASWEWTDRKSRQAVRRAIAALKECLATVAGYGNQFRFGPDAASFAAADSLDRGYSGGLRNFTIGPDLLGRSQSIQLILAENPEPSALTTVLGFDMTHCAVWIDEVALKLGEPELTLGLPCEGWKQAALQRKGYMPKVNRRPPPSRALLQKRHARRLKYRLRGFTVGLVSRRRLRAALGAVASSRQAHRSNKLARVRLSLA